MPEVPDRVIVPAFHYRVEVPVVLTLEVRSTLDAEKTIMLVMEAFSPGRDALLGANVNLTGEHFKIYPVLEIAIARTREAVLNGRVSLEAEL